MTDSNTLSRRSLLGGLASTGAVAIGCGDPAPPAGPNPDIGPLNDLLRSEYDAIKAYAAGIAILNMPPMGESSMSLAQAPVLVAIATNWQAQHSTHAAQLAALITSIGGTPVNASTVNFTPPMGFTPSINNVARLACNKERLAAVAYNHAVRQLKGTNTRFLAGSIEGDETQHFVVLYALLQHVVAADSTALLTVGVGVVVPQPFVAQIGTMTNSLQTLPDLPYCTPDMPPGTVCS